jgi:hypothetical protein
VHDLGSLYLTVRRMAADGAIDVRGKPKAAAGRRATYDSDKGPAGLDVVPRRWVAFDWDNLPLEWQPCPNPRWAWEPHPLLEPWVGARIALRRLPPAFRNASLFWQVSAGAGFDLGFRLRTWHWLDHPVTGDELKIWLSTPPRSSPVLSIPRPFGRGAAAFLERAGALWRRSLSTPVRLSAPRPERGAHPGHPRH